jgi:hypothetical protein
MDGRTLTYLLIYDDGHESHSNQYDSLGEVAESLFRSSYLESYSLFQVIKEFDVKLVVAEYTTALEEARQVALAKLNDKDKEALGLIKA